jgi:hypothetical protein
MNTFDFYTFTISLGTKKATMCKQLGLDRSKVISHKSWVTYGYKSYPKFTYSYTVGYMDAPGATPNKVDAMRDELSKKYGMPVSVSYIARD